MESSLVGFYCTFVIILGSIAYAGLENTLVLVKYVELRIRLSWIHFKSNRLKKRLKRELDSCLKKLQNEKNGR